MDVNTTMNIEEINGVKYEVCSNYIGEISLLELLKKLIKRDIEKQGI